MKWIKHKWVISTFLLISIFSAVLLYNHLTVQKDEVKYDDFSTKVDKILLFGDKQQYVVGLNKEGRGTGAEPTQNYLVSQERRMQERLANNNHQLEGDYWYLILHDLRTKDFKERKIDLYKELYRYDYQLQPWGWDPVYYKGKDYVAVQVTHKEAPDTQNGRSRYLFWDIEAEKFQEAPQDFDVKTYREEMDMGFGPTNLKEAMKPNNVGVLMWYISFLDTGKDFPKNRNINFYKENPSIINLM